MSSTSSEPGNGDAMAERSPLGLDTVIQVSGRPPSSSLLGLGSEGTLGGCTERPHLPSSKGHSGAHTVSMSTRMPACTSAHTQLRPQRRRGAWGETGLGTGSPEPSAQPPRPCPQELRLSAHFSEPQAHSRPTAGGEGQTTLPHWGPTCWDLIHCLLREGKRVGAVMAGWAWLIPVSLP